MTFTPIPAIDILGGSCVRLEKGDYNASTTYSEDPAAVGANFARAGLRRIHLVDLDGAREGRPVNVAAVAKTVQEIHAVDAGIEVHLGGGLRSVDDIKLMLGKGVSKVVLGTAAIKDPGFLAEACQLAPGKVILGLDARNGKLAVKGWLENTDVDVIDFAVEVVESGVSEIIYTDIDRDGVMTGPNVAATAKLSSAVPCNVFASGGVRSVEDLAALREAGVAGAIIGKAIYAGQIAVEDLAAVASAAA